MSEPELRPGLEKVPAAESAVSFIDGQRARLEYRGIAVETLARESNFEEVSWLLIKGALPIQKELADFSHELRQRRGIHHRLVELIRLMPENGHAMDALQSSIAALGMYHPSRDVEDEASNWEATLRLIAATPTLVAANARLRRGEQFVEPRDDLDHAANFYWMLRKEEPSPAVRKVVDACLILHAEHTMNASTFTARVVGSTLADPFTVMSSAIGALTGPLHGGANEAALEMFKSIGSVEKVRSWYETNTKKIMGMGHRVYKVKDPRAVVLEDLAENVFAESGKPLTYDIAKELEKVAGEKLASKGIYPNVDFFSGVVYEALGIPPDVFTPIFAIARISGWLAHWHEQLQGNRIYRPSQIYVGKRDVEYVPLEKRA